VQHAASDEMVSKAARVSTLGGAAADRTPEDDRGLIRFLMKNRHGSPFEHGLFTWKISAPIFVWREMMRHRIASYNEESGRYRELEGVFYAPGPYRPLMQTGKAGHYEFEDGDLDQYTLALDVAAQAYHQCWTSYRQMLDAGIAKELARIVLPVATYSTAFVTMNPRALMNFLSLRTKSRHSTYPSYPMYEINQVADAMEVDFRRLMPMTAEAFDEAGRVQP
jgi:thymidylate synthase (FAD)